MPLPFGYKQVEYIESTGTQCIDTEIIPVANIRIEVDFMLTESQSTGGIVSAELTWKSNMCSIDAWAYRYGTGYQQHTLTANKRYSVILDNGVFTENGTSVFTASGSVSTSIPLTIFAVNRGDSQNEFAKARLYSAKITSDGIVVRDFVPCVNMYGTPGLYDMVSRRFFRNIGSGTFLYGEVVHTIMPGVMPVVEGEYRDAIGGYVRIEGVWKPIIEIFSIIDGVRHSNLSPVVLYTWKKYELLTTQTYSVAFGATSEDIFGGSLFNSYKLYSSYEVNESTGEITLTGNSKNYMPINASTTSTSTFEQYPYVKANEKYYKFDLNGGGRKGFRMMLIGQEHASKGEYIEDVTSEIPDAYPENDHIYGYWYVFQG